MGRGGPGGSSASGAAVGGHDGTALLRSGPDWSRQALVVRAELRTRAGAVSSLTVAVLRARDVRAVCSGVAHAGAAGEDFGECLADCVLELGDVEGIVFEPPVEER